MTDRLVWRGRLPGPAGALDGWSAGHQELTARIEATAELVLLDPVSFPWPLLAAERVLAPVSVVLPASLPAGTVADLLGEPLLSRLTPFDRLVESRPEVRAELARRWGLEGSGTEPAVRADGRAAGWADCWSDGWERTPDDLARARAGKAAHVRGGALLAAAVRAGLVALPDVADGPVLALGGAVAGRRQRLAAATGASTVPLESAEPGSTHAAVVLLPDGGPPAGERAALLARAVAALRPGGALVVLGHVVTAPGGPANPSVSALVEEVLAASGGAVHLEDLESVRWPGEPYARGVLLRLRSLAATPARSLA